MPYDLRLTLSISDYRSGYLNGKSESKADFIQDLKSWSRQQRIVISTIIRAHCATICPQAQGVVLAIFKRNTVSTSPAKKAIDFIAYSRITISHMIANCAENLRSPLFLASFSSSDLKPLFLLPQAIARIKKRA